MTNQKNSPNRPRAVAFADARLWIVTLLAVLTLFVPPADAQVSDNLWYFVRVEDVNLAKSVPGLSYQITRADADGGSVEVTVSGDIALENCPGGSRTYRFNWYITGTDADGVKTVRNGEPFLVRYEATATAAPPCFPWSGAYIGSTGTHNHLPDSSKDLFGLAEPPEPDRAFWPTVNGQTGPYHGPDTHKLVTTTRYTVSGIPRGVFIMEINVTSWGPALQIVYVFESNPASPPPDSSTGGGDGSSGADGGDVSGGTGGGVSDGTGVGDGSSGTSGGGAECTWTGTWDTSYNTMELTQDGDKVTGSYTYNDGKLEGTIAGNVLSGTWTEPNASGGFQFTMAADCNSFTGTFGRGSDASSGGTWNGTRSGTGSPPRPQPDPSVPNMTLQAAERSVVTEQTVQVPVWLINSNNLANLNFEVKYDPSVVRLEGKPDAGNLLSNALFSANAQDPGVIRIGLAQRSGAVASLPSGTVVELRFLAVGQPGMRTPLELTVTTINDPNGGVLTIDRIDGAIWIMDKDGNFPTSDSGGNESGDGTGGSGGTGSNAPVVIPRGNCEGDTTLQEIDALCALDMSTGLRQPVSLMMDMDRSSDVTSRDAVLILQQIVRQGAGSALGNPAP